MKPSNTLTINLHGLYVEDALEKLRDFVANAPKTAERIIVIHGYNKGTALRDAVRNRFRSPRVQEISPRLGNDGESVIWLKR